MRLPRKLAASSPRLRAKCVATEKEELLQFFGIEVLSFEQACCLRATGCDGQHGCLSEINNMAKVFCVVILRTRYDVQVCIFLTS